MAMACDDRFAKVTHFKADEGRPTRVARIAPSRKEYGRRNAYLSPILSTSVTRSHWSKVGRPSFLLSWFSLTFFQENEINSPTGRRVLPREESYQFGANVEYRRSELATRGVLHGARAAPWALLFCLLRFRLSSGVSTSFYHRCAKGDALSPNAPTWRARARDEFVCAERSRVHYETLRSNVLK